MWVKILEADEGKAQCQWRTQRVYSHEKMARPRPFQAFP